VCGICGELTTNGEPASVAALQVMTECMRSRGPDSAGIHLQDGAGFGHRRLSIIDLSDAAGQPMVDSELGLALVFNGCIYNYPELRAQLQDRGYRFFSSSDTEVVLKAYHAWGSDCVDRFNGMFAFAVRERDTGRVVLARDRLGIKPLYYTGTGSGLRFASSLPALVRAGGVDTDIDPVAFHHYMTLHSVVPAPRTILRGVRKLAPATVLTVEPDGERRYRTYWSLDSNPDPALSGISREEWRERLLAALELAVDRRMIADVPVGVLLSGGLDSSLVVGMLARNGQTGLETFSIGFDAVNDEAGDEFHYSDIVADRFGTRHHQLRISAERTLAALGDCIAAMSEPMVSHDAIGFYLLSQEVSRHVKVVQSGQGADEVFAGYHWYPPMMDTDDALAAYSSALFDCDHAGYARAVHPRLVEDDHTTAFVAGHFARPGADRPIDKALRLDTTVLLVDDPVKRVDNMTMAWGLEARVPFLDHELVELAARIPAELKVRDGGKYILKEAARSVIPAEVIDRPKGYFPVPALKYLRGEFLARVRDALTDPAARGRGLFNDDYVAELIADPERHITPLRGSRLWQLGLLELWLQAHEL
jgi:asparagine synthase (glutamine-hydrolysing)